VPLPDQDFHRVKRLPPYVFEQVNKLKAQARARGEDIIDFGMGNPDLPTPQHIVDKLVETVAKPRTHRYSASKGIPGLRRAQAAYYERRFGVKLNPDTQIVATLGSKEGFANMAQAITAPGDVILSPSPTYQSMNSASSFQARRSARCPRNRMKNFFARSTVRCGTRSRSRWRWSSAIPRTRPR
jgi:aspartate/methionine/tyrosine aminotransferase